MSSNRNGPYSDPTLNEWIQRPCNSAIYNSVKSPERPISGTPIPVGYSGSNGSNGSSSSSTPSKPNQSSNLGRGEPGPQRN